MEGNMMSYGWGYVGSNENGFEWLFTPDGKDSAYLPEPGTGRCYSCCCCKSGYVFKSEMAAIRAGEKWMKEAGRSGTVAAIKSEPKHLEY